jgi:hypothetical protein
MEEDVVAAVYAVAAGEALGLGMRSLRRLRRLLPAAGLEVEIVAAARTAACLALREDDVEANFPQSGGSQSYRPDVVAAIRRVAPLIQPILPTNGRPQS